MLPSKCDVVVVGAGLAGLAAARELTVAGRDVHLLEASDYFGGRVRTDFVDGLRLDRGFQLYNPSYREGARILDLEALQLRQLSAGLIVSIDRKQFRIGDPIREPSWLLDGLQAPVGSAMAKIKFARYAAKVALGAIKIDDVDQRSDAFLTFAFGKKMTERLLRPFLAGVFLEDDLQTSKRFLDLALRAFVRGTPGVPANGMGSISEQIAAQLAQGVIHLNTQVTSINNGLIQTSAGQIQARSVVVATNSRHAKTLIPTLHVPQTNSVTTFYHLADCEPHELTDGRSTLIVDGLKYESGTADPKRPLINTVVLTHAAPSYATNERVLVSSSMLGMHDNSASELAARKHLESLYRVSTDSWTHVATYAIQDALPRMSAPHELAKSNRLGDGLYLAGDHRNVSSINGALMSGRAAATALLEDGN